MGQGLLRFLVDPRIDTAEGVRLFLGDAGHAWLWLALVGLVAGVSIWSHARFTGRVRLALRRGMIAARLLFLLLLFCLLLRPSLRYSRLRTPVVAVLVDASASFSISDPAAPEAYLRAAAARLGVASNEEAGKASRARVAEALLKTCVIPQIAETKGEGYVVRVFTWGGGLEETDKLGAASEPRTDLAGALDAAERQLRGAPWLATVLVSDGVVNSGDDPREAAARLGDRGVPIYSIGLGGPEERRDVRLAEVSAPEFAFVGSRVPVHFTVAWNGFEGPITAKLLEDGKETQTIDLEMKQKNGSLRASFALSIDAPGKRMYEIVLPPREGEATEANNHRRFSVEALDAFQVLYVTGTPDPEFAFLRRFLERDNQIRVTVLLRAPGGGKAFLNRSTRPADRKLTEFPSTSEELRPYQAVLFGDVERDTFTTAQVEALRAFVAERGGGFAMLGGMHSFGMGGWAGSPVEDLLPVRLAEKEEPVEDLFHVRLTPEGRESPLFQSTAGASQTGAFWDALPAFAGMNGVLGAKPGATVLATHPSRGNANGNWVICATARCGKGRVLALAVDETWRWRFQEAYDEKNLPAQVYRDFWGQAVRWLGIPAERPGLRLLLPKKEFSAGEEVIVRAQLLDENLEAKPGAKVSVEVTTEGGQPIAVEMSAAAGEKGVFRGAVPSLAIGSYAVKATSEAIQDTDVVSIEEPAMEAERTARDAALLADVARLSGGRSVDLAEADQVPGWIAGIEYADRRGFREVGEAELWDAWSVLALLLGLLTIEWALRKRAGIL